MAKKTASTIANAMGVDISPSLHLSVTDLPAIKSWKVGSTYNISLKVKQTAMQEGGFDGKQPLSADFKVISATSGDSNDSEDDEDY